MFCLKANSYLLTVLVCFPLVAFAEDGEAPSIKAAETINRELIEYNSKEGRLNSLVNKMKDAQERFNQNLAEKNRTTDEAKKKELAVSMMAIAKERNSLVTEYNGLRQELLYRYPNKGQEIDKRFIPRKHKSLAEMENTTDLDRQLTKVKKRIGEKYAPLMPPEDLTATPVNSESKTKVEPDKRLRLVK